MEIRDMRTEESRFTDAFYQVLRREPSKPPSPRRLATVTCPGLCIVSWCRCLPPTSPPTVATLRQVPEHE